LGRIVEIVLLQQLLRDIQHTVPVKLMHPDAAASIESTAVTGDKNEIVIAPFFKVAICWAVKG